MRRVVLCAGLSFALCAPLAAQDSRIYVSINAAAQAAATRITDHFEFERNVELGSADLTYPAKPGLVFDGGAGIRLWKNIGAGVAVSHLSRSDTVRVVASIPHPLLFQRPRQVEGDLRGVTHAETGVHVHVLYLTNAGRRLRVVLAAGPSLIKLEQEAASAIQYDDTFPFDSATFRTATTRRVKKSVAAFNAGADLMFGARIGVGGLLRFVHGRANLTAPIAAPEGSILNPRSSRQLRVDAGGLQGGAGIRILF